MTRRPIVLLDCDGPLADFSGSYLRALYQETCCAHGVHEIDQWSIHKCGFFIDAARKTGVDPSELRRRVDAHVLRPGWCSSLTPTRFSQICVDDLHELADVYVVTSPWDSSVTWMHERLHWLNREFNVPRGNVIQAGKKHLVFGDVFVDDKPEHVEAWLEQWPNGRALLFDMPHNRNADPRLERTNWLPGGIVDVVRDVARDDLAPPVHRVTEGGDTNGC